MAPRLSKADRNWRRTEFTYKQLDRVLRLFDFTCRLCKREPPQRVYEHASGAIIMIPNYPPRDRVVDFHLVAVRGTLNTFGIADPTAFAAELQKAG